MIALRNVAWGLGQAAWAVAACMLFVALASWHDASPSLREFPTFLRFYGSMGVAAGLALGLGRPLLRSALGRAIVGFTVALPVIYVAMFRPPAGSGAAVDSFSIATWVVLAAFLGPALAAYITFRNRQRAERSARPDA